MTSTPGKAPQRLHRSRVRAIADAHEQRVRVEPHRVAALRGGAASAPTIGTPAAASEAAMASGCVLRRFLARSKQHGAQRSDEHRVVDVDRVGISGIVVRDHDLRPAASSRPQKRSCSAAAAAWSGASRQPYSRQRSTSSASGGRTRTRLSAPTSKRCRTQSRRDATRRFRGLDPRGARREAPRRRACPLRGASRSSRSRCAA